MGKPITDSLLPTMNDIVSPIMLVDHGKIVSGVEELLRRELAALKEQRQDDEQTLRQLRAQMTQFYLRNESLLQRKEEKEAQLQKELENVRQEVLRLKRENEDYQHQLVFRVCQEKQILRENEEILSKYKAVAEHLQHCTCSGKQQQQQHVHFDINSDADRDQVEQTIHDAISQCHRLISENEALEERYQRTVQAAVQTCDRLRSKNRALEHKLKHCRCQSKQPHEPAAPPEQTKTTTKQKIKAESKSKAHSQRDELPPQQRRQQQSASSDTTTSAPRRTKKTKQSATAPASRKPTTDATDLHDQRYIAFPKINSLQQHWDEELAAHPVKEDRRQSEKHKQVVEEENSAATSSEEEESSEEEATPAAVVNTKTRGFYIQESPAEAWRRRKEAEAHKKNKPTKHKAQKCPVEKRIMNNKATAAQGGRGPNEFMARFKKMGLGGAEHVVEASGAVETSAGVIVTARGVTYHGKTAIEKQEEAKVAREEAEWKAQKEEEKRKRKVERALRGGKADDYSDDDEEEEDE